MTILCDPIRVYKTLEKMGERRCGGQWVKGQRKWGERAHVPYGESRLCLNNEYVHIINININIVVVIIITIIIIIIII